MQEEHRTSRVKLMDFDTNLGLDSGASRPKEICWYLCKVFFFLSALPYPIKFKVFLLRTFGAKVGHGVTIKPRVNIHFPWKLDIGNDVWIGEEAHILNFEKVGISNNVCISQRAFLCGGNHNYLNTSMAYRKGPITLTDGCWIGACCFIGPNATIGVDSVVSAGSVVTSYIPANLVCSSYPKAFNKARWNNSPYFNNSRGNLFYT